MAATQVPSKLGWGGSGLNDSLKTVLDGIARDTSLGHVNISLVTGASASSDITLTGLAADDVLIGAVVIHGMNAATPAFTSVAVVPTTGIAHSMTLDATPVARALYLTLDIDTSDALVYILWSKAADKNIIPAS